MGEMRFAAVKRLLKNHGWDWVRIHGSHHIFFKRGRLILSIPVHKGKVKPVYVRKVHETIENDGPLPPTTSQDQD